MSSGGPTDHLTTDKGEKTDAPTETSAGTASPRDTETPTETPSVSIFLQWAFETNSDVRSSPAVVNGTVYVGSFDNNVYGIDASEGTEQWRFQTGDEVRTSPVVADGTVYVGSVDNNVYALTEVRSQ